MPTLQVRYLENYASDWERLGYKHADDSGLDLRAAIAEPITIPAGRFMCIPCGVALELRGDGTDYEIQLRARSGLAAKFGIGCVNGVGTIDYGYRGEIKALLINFGTQDFVINPGDRIAQAVVCPICRPTVETVTELTTTTRETSGFGSTGIF